MPVLTLSSFPAVTFAWFTAAMSLTRLTPIRTMPLTATAPAEMPTPMMSRSPRSLLLTAMSCAAVTVPFTAAVL